MTVNNGLARTEIGTAFDGAHFGRGMAEVPCSRKESASMGG